MSTFVLLLAMHALADYCLQPPGMVAHKAPHRCRADCRSWGPWWWTMAAHALVNGLGVFAVTGSVALLVGETVAHFCLDTWKCQGRITAWGDQLGHVACKLLWSLL